jgi:hypothetical protein
MNDKKMTRILITLLASALVLASCSLRNGRDAGGPLIPEKELPALLAEIYMADGLLSLPGIRAMYQRMDSVSGYVEVIEKHGYTKEAMDRTLKYYFMRKPKRMQDIYDRTLGILSEMESVVERENLILQNRISNIWMGRPFYVIPDPSGSDTARFDFPIELPGYYVLRFRAVFYPGDQLTPALFAGYVTHRDSASTGKRHYIRHAAFIKDGQPHDYEVRILVPNDRPLRLRGFFYDTGSHPPPFEKHALFTNISLTYVYSVI